MSREQQAAATARSRSERKSERVREREKTKKYDVLCNALNKRENVFSLLDLKE
jgi:hypothetical protein